MSSLLPSSPTEPHPNNTSAGVKPSTSSTPSTHVDPIGKNSTASHPPAHKPDPTLSSNDRSASAAADNTSTTTSHLSDAAQRGLAAPGAPAAAELPRLKMRLSSALRQFPDFPSKGILFEDILPIFADPTLHADLIRALELHVREKHGSEAASSSAGADAKGSSGVDVVVGLDARGFLFGPSLALKLGAGFVPVRKRGKLPGDCVTASFEKEYGQDFFQMQADAIKKGQRVLIVDDIIATGGSAAAAGSLVKQLGGTLLGYVFMLELDFLKGRDKLDAPVYTLLSSQEK